MWLRFYLVLYSQHRWQSSIPCLVLVITVEQFTAGEAFFWREEHMIVVIDELRECGKLLQKHARGNDAMGDTRSSRKGFWKTRRLLKNRLIEGNRGSGNLGDATRADSVYPMSY
jgi:hypothetical protein